MQKIIPNLPAIKLSDYHYELPEERIAKYPLKQRDQSKLQLYRQGEIQHTRFEQLPNFLESGSLLVFNDTKVIPARLYMRRKTGALIEILLLNPEEPKDVQQAMQATESALWHCMIGRKKRWKDGEVLVLQHDDFELKAELMDREKNEVRLSWSDEWSFVDILEKIGEMPLPPYLQRKAEKSDEEQYQTIYSKVEGAVAAPTAGLHFTQNVFDQLDQKQIKRDFLTLHVSAGTFQPVKHENALEHPMHAEQIVISQQNLQQLIQHYPNIIAVGTTSMRSLESLYWFGIQLLTNEQASDSTYHFRIPKLYPYSFQANSLPPTLSVLQNILDHMQANHIERLIGETEIYIFPSYPFQVCQGLITNYHMPDTTLLLLVSAFIGEDWRRVYQEALENDYRFLSYGDSSLLWRS